MISLQCTVCCCRLSVICNDNLSRALAAQGAIIAADPGAGAYVRVAPIWVMPADFQDHGVCFIGRTVVWRFCQIFSATPAAEAQAPPRSRQKSSLKCCTSTLPTNRTLACS